MDNRVLERWGTNRPSVFGVSSRHSCVWQRKCVVTSSIYRMFKVLYQRQCSYFFPRAFPDATSANPQADAINQKYGGWNITIPRLFFSNGKSKCFSSFIHVSIVRNMNLNFIPTFSQKTRGARRAYRLTSTLVNLHRRCQSWLATASTATISLWRTVTAMPLCRKCRRLDYATYRNGSRNGTTQTLNAHRGIKPVSREVMILLRRLSPSVANAI